MVKLQFEAGSLKTWEGLMFPLKSKAQLEGSRAGGILRYLGPTSYFMIVFLLSRQLIG